MIDALHYYASLTELYAKPRCLLGSSSPGNFPAFYWHYKPITTCLKNNPNQKQQLGFLGEFSLKKKRKKEKNLYKRNPPIWRFLAHCCVNLVQHLHVLPSSNATPEL